MMLMMIQYTQEWPASSKQACQPHTGGRIIQRGQSVKVSVMMGVAETLQILVLNAQFRNF